MKYLPDVMLLANGSREAMDLLGERLVDSKSRSQRIIQGRLAPIAVDRFEAVGLGDLPAVDLLRPALARNLAWAAQLQAAVTACSEFSQEHGCELLLIKGAANARSLYPRVALRLGNDIDVIMHPADMERIWPGSIAHAKEHGCAIDHLDRKSLVGMPVEFHCRWGYADQKWGSSADCFVDSVPCADFVGLRLPSAMVSLTITLTHAYKERGVLPYDWLDLSMQLPAVGDWSALAEFWIFNDLVGQVLPALLVANRIGLPVDGDMIHSLRNAVPVQVIRNAEVLAGFMTATRHRFLREEWMESRLAGESFLGRCWPKFSGSPVVTERLTGLKPGMPGYTRQHYCALPAKRFRRLF